MDEPNDCAVPTPGPEHAQLLDNVGAWTVECQYYTDPTQPPMRLRATETVEAVGPFWTVSRFEAEMMPGLPFVGRATLGYDPREGRWRGTWVDSTSPHLFVMEGDRDAATGVLEMTCQGPNAQTGEWTTFRSTETPQADGSRRLEFFMRLPDGNELPMFRYVYRRA